MVWVESVLMSHTVDRFAGQNRWWTRGGDLVLVEIRPVAIVRPLQQIPFLLKAELLPHCCCPRSSCGRFPMNPDRHLCAPETLRTFRASPVRFPSAGDRGEGPRRVAPQSRRTCFVRLTTLSVLLAVSLTGCGKTMQRNATEQLVLSDAVDRSISRIDFMPLSGRRCYLDSTNLAAAKMTTFVNAAYVIGSLRNQLVAAGCLLVETRTEAEIVLEPRLGTLGTDAHEVSYGIPSNNLLNQAASMMPAAPPVPTIPEISFARKDNQTAAAKVAVFAYDAKTGARIWQSGIAVARSSVRESWFFGVGPFQSGAVYESPRFIGARLKVPLIGENRNLTGTRQVVSLNEVHLFELPQPAPATVPQPAPATVPQPVEPLIAAPPAEKTQAEAPQTAVKEAETQTK